MRASARIAVLAVFAALAAFGCRSVSEAPAQQKIAPDDGAAAPAPAPAKVVYPNVPGSFVAAVKRLKPSVVNIFTAQIVRDQSPLGIGLGDLFGLRRDRVQRSLGSGFVIDSQGYILTNFHVVQGAREILVQTEDGREVAAQPIGAEPNIDVALLHVEASGLTPVSFGDSNALEVGEWVLAIGNPFGLSQTVTAGIVSAKGRDSREIGMGQSGYQNFIQTDASINPGNSGGPLANVAGDVIGINTAIAAAGQGIGFAVPIAMVQPILPQLKTTGRVVPAWIGIGIRELDADTAAKMGAPAGVLVTEVFDDGPAARSGLKVGDVIERFNGSEVGGVSELAWLTNTAGVGNDVALTIWRNGREQSVSVKVEPKPLTR
jgi:serine protease Do